MIRPYFGVQALGASAQPVFGTTLTAASHFAVDRFTGTNKPGATTPPVTVVLESSASLIVGDRVAVGPGSNFTVANRGNLDHGTVASIALDGVTITVQGLLQNHASGEFLVLDEPASFVQITPITNTALMYLGTDSTVSASDTSVFDVLAPIADTSEPTYSHISPTTGVADSYQTSQYWIDGAAASTFIARFHQN